MNELVCNRCGKIFKNKNPKSSLFSHKNFCDKMYSFLDKYNYTVEDLKEQYKFCGSVLEFSKRHDNFKSSYKLFKFFNIEISASKSASSNIVKKRKENAYLKKYGCKHNFCKNSESRQNWEKKMLKEEGITNVFQRKEVKEKIVNTLIKKYGSVTKGRVVKTHHQGSPISKIHKKVIEILKQNNIEFIIEFPIKYSNINYFKYDILLIKNNKIIEINGDKWHANPFFYEEDDIIIMPGTERTAKEIWERDDIKIQVAKNNNFSTLVLWENEINNNFSKIQKEVLNYATN